ncbi:hypothetical protein IFO70_34795 [Phormidium tenue FACHB-886]|nr:hypothetical protein [Phormidium tenue FACHB-886]
MNWLLVQPQTPQWQYRFIPSQSIRNFHKRLPEKLFQVWQDLFLEATGSDTVWGYPIPLMHIAQQLGIAEANVIILLAQLEIPGYEHMANSTAITFHTPIA